MSPLWWHCPEAGCGNGSKMSAVLMTAQLGHQPEEKSCSAEVRCETVLRHCTLCWKGLHLRKASLLLCFELSCAPVIGGRGGLPGTLGTESSYVMSIRMRSSYPGQGETFYLGQGESCKEEHRMSENSGYLLTSIIPLFLYSKGSPYGIPSLL